ncbi:MAG: hypothetical protein ACYCPE_10795 [Metallibacterium sp.]
MTYQVGKIDAASDQLDWSIKLFLDHKAYVPAITLAGAAEEIIGQTLGSEAAFNLLKERLSIKTGLSPAVVSQMYLNRAKNWLKHWRDMRDEETIDIELETEAIQYIVRAVINLAAHDKSCTSETPRFFLIRAIPQP